MKKLKVIILGCGLRGQSYAAEMGKLKDKFEVVAVADPRKANRERIRDIFPIPDENCFDSWEEVLAKPKMADIAVITTVDNMHYAPALQAIALGYDLLLEKPAAQTAQECVDIVLTAERAGVKVLVCHVLRYTDFFGKIKQLIMDGKLGDIMSVMQVEAVGHIHQSHSYVRGNWHSEKESTPMLLAKCCHDLDIIQWLLDKPCKQVQSFGKLSYFTKAYAPEGAPVRCIDGGCPVEDTCYYNCRKYYVDNKGNTLYRGLLASIARPDAKEVTDEAVLEVLQKTDYGLCVFHANNDVVDHQIVNMEFEGGITASLTMNCFNDGGRYIRVFGTKGDLQGNISDDELTFFSFEDTQIHKIPVKGGENTHEGGHAGGDAGIIRELYEYMVGTYTGFRAADISTSVKNHLIGFAAEISRHNKTVESLDDYIASLGMKNEYQ